MRITASLMCVAVDICHLMLRSVWRGVMMGHCGNTRARRRCLLRRVPRYELSRVLSFLPSFYAYMYTHMHTYAHAFIHACTNRRARARARPHTTHTHTHTHTHKHTHTHTHTRGNGALTSSPPPRPRKLSFRANTRIETPRGTASPLCHKLYPQCLVPA